MRIPLPPAPEGRPPAPAKLRVLETSDELFSREGIRAVGVDRIIASSRVTKATFYKHFRAKDRLVVDYLAARHRRVAHELAARLEPLDDPALALEEVLAWTRDAIGDPAQRGDAFLAAAIEHPDPGHPARGMVVVHRNWLRSVLSLVLEGLGHPAPAAAAEGLLIARDGTLLGAYADGRAAAGEALARAFAAVAAEARR